MLEIAMDQEACEGCMDCVLACPTNRLWMNETTMKARVADIRQCIVCRNCEEHCPKQVIQVRLEESESRWSLQGGRPMEEEKP